MDFASAKSAHGMLCVKGTPALAPAGVLGYPRKVSAHNFAMYAPMGERYSRYPRSVQVDSKSLSHLEMQITYIQITIRPVSGKLPRDRPY